MVSLFLLLYVSNRLAGLNLFWEVIPVSVGDVIQSAVKRLAKGFNQQEISNIIYRYVDVLYVTVCDWMPENVCL
jgi:hypothetical protein